MTPSVTVSLTGPFVFSDKRVAVDRPCPYDNQPLPMDRSAATEEYKLTPVFDWGDGDDVDESDENAEV